MLTFRAFAYLSKILARSSDTLPKIAIPLSCYHADMSELGSELIKVARSLVIPADRPLKAGLSPGKIVREGVRGFRGATHSQMCCLPRGKHLSQYQIDSRYITNLAEDAAELAAECLFLRRLIRLVLWLAILVCQGA
jgi:hypothetical protein